VNNVEWDSELGSLVAKGQASTSILEEYLDLEEDTDLKDKTSTPAIFEEYPDLEPYIRNVIETNPKIQMPALLHSISEVFYQDGITQDIIFDNELQEFINNIMINNVSTSIEPSYDTLGRGVGINKPSGNDQNDVWLQGLMPYK
jgi:hypothetical protein